MAILAAKNSSDLAGAALAASRGRTASRRLWVDRAARWIVTAGGMAIIASILGILLFILLEVVPLWRPAQVETARTLAVERPIAALVTDPYRSLVTTLASDGAIRVLTLADGTVVEERRFALPLSSSTLEPAGDAPDAPAKLVAVKVPPGAEAFAGATTDGRVVVQAVDWEVTFDSASGARKVRAGFPAPVELALDPLQRPLGAFTAQIEGVEKAVAAAQLADGEVVLVKRETVTNDFSGEVSSSEERFEFAAVPKLTALVADREQRNLFGGTAAGEIYWWHLDRGSGSSPDITTAGASTVTALTFLIGDRSLVVGQESGAISVWFPVRLDGSEEFTLSRIRDFPAHGAAIRTLSPSQRNRTFVATDAAGVLGLYYSTSERTLWKGRVPVPEVTALALAPKGDGAIVAGAGSARGELGASGAIAELAIRNPHPEISWTALFGKVFYEGYEQPEYSWQSTGGTDDFESKFSLTPLLVGTLKGTFYSLLLAIPLGVFGAMFASQFLHPKLLNLVKPTVEIMAALPSVVLGFLAGLWLAPLIERYFPALVLALLVLPVIIWLAGLTWNALPLGFRQRYPSGTEIFLYILVLVAGIWGCFELSPLFERVAFGGNFQSWLLAATGLKYDQRNAVVVGLAMGFAVIPIIFAISEDAFSNVPRNLVAGSLALGANRWQTVTRVVLPTASPGIFSAIMIGFGRAIGETMIVLMATGNTPIMEMSAFNGFRTLSANIAVEIPEAPHGGTLYRTLFLAALLLFGLTFVVNTAAELVRQRLRNKYSKL
jgi:phosphate transport system permease protein